MRDWTIETALAASKATGGDRLVLIIIAGHRSPAREVAYPGIRRIAEMAGCALSTVSRRVARLVASGDLVVEESGSGHRAARYRIPAVDDALVRECLAFPSDGALQPLAIPSERNATDGGDLAIPPERNAKNGDASVAFRQRSTQGGTEVRSNYLVGSYSSGRARARGDLSEVGPADADPPASIPPPVADSMACARARLNGGGPMS